MGLSIQAGLGGDAQASVALTPFEQAMYDGRAYSAGTGKQFINSNTVLGQTFENPAGSGVNAIITLYRFYNNRKADEEPLTMGYIVNPANLTAGNLVTPTGHKPGQAASQMVFWWDVASYRLDSDPSTPNPLGFILPTGGQDLKIDTPIIIGPGSSFGFYIQGSTKNRDEVSINYAWYEEAI